MFTRRIWGILGLIILFVQAVTVHQLKATPPVPGEEDGSLVGSLRNEPVVVEGVVATRPFPTTASIQSLTARTNMSENFEGAWPGNGWELVDDSGSDGGVYLWGKRNCHPRTGSFAGWSVGSGTQGSSLNCAAEYPNNARSWAIYGPFDLSDATSASLSFYVWGATAGATDCPWDYLFAGHSNDGLSFSGTRNCGDWTNGDAGNGYHASSLDLSSELGQSQVWIGFLFSSNDSVTNVGFTLDDVTLDINTSPDGTVYLPVVMKPGNLPANAPTLHEIVNSDGDQYYAVSWTDVSDATNYILEEDDNDTFTRPTAVYSGADTSTAISVSNKGAYYYRVKAVNNFGGSDWSNAQSVEVTTVTTTPTYVANIPCLLAIKNLSSQEISWFAGCVGSRGGPQHVTYRYDTYGRISGFDLTVEDSQGLICYEALVDVARDTYGRVSSYDATISDGDLNGTEFPEFTEHIVNEYDPNDGSLDRADVMKIYTDFNDSYTMDFTPCSSGTSWVGYQVNVWSNDNDLYDGDLLTVGNCN